MRSTTLRRGWKAGSRTLEGDRQLLGAVLGGMAEGVIAVDSRRRLLFANEAAGRLFGIGPGAVGKLVAELIRSPSVQDAVDATLAGPASHRAEISITDSRPFAAARSLDVQGTPLPGLPPPGAVLVFTTLPTCDAWSGCGRTSSPTPRTS